MRQDQSGFTILEVLVAIVIMSLGLLALAQSSGAVTGMIGRGKQDTQAAMAVQARLDSLRQVARNTTPRCTALSNGSATGPAPGLTTSWTVSGSGDSRTVVMSVSYRVRRGTRTEVVQSVMGCL